MDQIRAPVEEGVEPTPTVVARRGGFSRKVLYEREDLRDLFDDEDEE